jgi:hypothetical protein
VYAFREPTTRQSFTLRSITRVCALRKSTTREFVFRDLWLINANRIQMINSNRQYRPRLRGASSLTPVRFVLKLLFFTGVVHHLLFHLFFHQFVFFTGVFSTSIIHQRLFVIHRFVFHRPVLHCVLFNSSCLSRSSLFFTGLSSAAQYFINSCLSLSGLFLTRALSAE